MREDMAFRRGGLLTRKMIFGDRPRVNTFVAIALLFRRRLVNEHGSRVNCSLDGDNGLLTEQQEPTYVPSHQDDGKSARAARSNGSPSSQREIPRRSWWFDRALVATPRRHDIRANAVQHHGRPDGPIHVDDRRARRGAPTRLLALDAPRPATHPQSPTIDPRRRPRELCRGHERDRDVVLVAGERARHRHESLNYISQKGPRYLDRRVSVRRPRGDGGDVIRRAQRDPRRRGRRRRPRVVTWRLAPKPTAG